MGVPIQKENEVLLGLEARGEEMGLKYSLDPYPTLSLGKRRELSQWVRTPFYCNI